MVVEGVLHNVKRREICPGECPDAVTGRSVYNVRHVRCVLSESYLCYVA